MNNSFKKETYCICNALAQLFKKSEGSLLSQDFFALEDVQQATTYLKERLDISPNQAVILSIIYERGEDGFTSISDIAGHLGCTVCTMKSMKNLFDDLTRRRIIHSCYYGDKQSMTFFIKRDVLNAYYNNESFEYERPVAKSYVRFFALMDEYYRQRFDKAVGVDELNMNVEDLIEASSNLSIVQKLNDYMCGLTKEDRRLFLLMVVLRFKSSNSCISYKNIKDFFTPEDSRALAYALFQGASLRREGLVSVKRKSKSNPLQWSFCLADDVIKELGLDYFELIEEEDEVEAEEKPFGFLDDDDNETLFTTLKHTDIVEKRLFYNQSEKQTMVRLTNLLDSKNYNKVYNGMIEKGLRGGICVLFYGGPGTGKTEGVKQLAKATGRDLMVVDFSQVRSKWVGDSEKNTKLIFDEYYKLKAKSKEVPILLLNEADAILGKRMEVVQRASDKMENTMQNILLQQMEDFDGIMVATTNMASTLDNAFERRFLVKLAFEKPSAEVRQLIWKEMIPALSSSEAKYLANAYDIAGGNMENVARKRVMEEILYQENLPFERMKALCEEETLLMKGPARKIGFQRTDNNS